MNLTQQFLEKNIPLKGHYKFTLTDIYTGEEQVFEYDNVVTRACWSMIANNFVDSTPDNTMLLNKALLGNGSTSGANAPAVTNTQLVSEVYRNNLASKSQDPTSTWIAYATAYFNATEITGTFTEAGIVVDGTSSADTGVLVSRVAINITKTTSHTLTLDWTLTIGA